MRPDLTEIVPEISIRDIIVFDGVCVLCSGFMRFVLRHDREEHFLFMTAQSAQGEALYAALGLKAGDYDTNLVFIDGQLYERLDAFAVVMRKLGWPWRALAILGWLPGPLKDWIYYRIARNRYAMFGRRETCMVPDSAITSRFIGHA